MKANYRSISNCKTTDTAFQFVLIFKWTPDPLTHPRHLFGITGIIMIAKPLAPKSDYPDSWANAGVNTAHVSNVLGDMIAKQCRMQFNTDFLIYLPI